jgi:uncharacterized protein (TIGR00369 family)
VGEIVKYSGCFVCGDKNPHGLRIRFFTDGDEAVAECVADERFQGFKGIYHGGITATLLDEIMAKAVLAKMRYGMTVEMSVRFKAAIMVGQKLRLVGRITREHGRIYETEGEVIDADGKVLASATGKYLEAPPSMRETLLASLE